MFNYHTRKPYTREGMYEDQPAREIWIIGDDCSVLINPITGELGGFVGKGGFQMPDAPFWVENKRLAVLIDPVSRKVLAYDSSHDGRPLDPIVYVPLVEAIALICFHEARLVSLRPFPTCAVAFPRVRAVDDACKAI